MIYRNDSIEALSAMENVRTGNYGEDGYFENMKTFICPICRTEEPEGFFVNDDDECVGCVCCVHKSETPYL